MSLVSTKTPIFDDIPSIEFFNGRLLSGEDMTTEQAWNAARRKLLGQALGSGVAFGLEVSVSTKTEHAGKPIVTVEPGLALNAEGATLSLTERTDVSLVRIEEIETVPAEFAACEPTQYSAYVKSDGVFLLTLCPAKGTQGRAPVSGLANQEARCNRKYRREGVQFRLHQLRLNEAELADRNKLRNLVAYKCFNPEAWQAFITDPFGTPDTKPKLLDGLLVPKLEDSEVPLAIVFWTTDGGVEYVDTWAARRKLLEPDALSGFSSQRDPLKAKDVASFPFIARQLRQVEAHAMCAQFQRHLSDVLASVPNPATVIAAEYFRYLPPFGIVPLQSLRLRGFFEASFFSGIVRRPPPGLSQGTEFIDARLLGALQVQALAGSPTDLARKEFIWVYRPWQNTKAAGEGLAVQPMLAFASGLLPNLAVARFDMARLDFSNYANCCGGS